jgi:hypothetical protein
MIFNEMLAGCEGTLSQRLIAVDWEHVAEPDIIDLVDGAVENATSSCEVLGMLWRKGVRVW